VIGNEASDVVRPLPNGIAMIHLEHFEVTTKGQMFKVVACENCRGEFVYLLTRDALGCASTAMFWDRAGTKERAANQAQAELHRALERGQDPVPCPACGWYQSSMIPLVRAAHLHWMGVIGALLVYLAVLCVVLGGLGHLSNERDVVAMGTSLLWAAAWTAGIGCGLILVRKFLAIRLQPNDGDPERRIHLGQQLARTRAEFDRLLAADGDRPTPA
jgi:hypothetical protein